MPAYYNEIDPFAADWLRQLIKGGHIADGIVDTRSIEDVSPSDLDGFNQCHFFAGIGVWSHALRLAGWPDDKPVWTASCPCQPFSSAGSLSGFDDERHLWPHLQWLIEQRKPAVVFGEQVASKHAEPWIDLVQTDLEAMDYAFGCVPFPSASVGAPHIRDRAYWMAYATGEQCENGVSRPRESNKAQAGWQAIESTGFCLPGRLANTNDNGCDKGRSGNTEKELCGIARGSSVVGVADDKSGRRGKELENNGRGIIGNSKEGNAARVESGGGNSGPIQTNGFWRDVDWIACRDGKWRPVRPGSFPLVNGTTNRVGRLRGYGNAINAQAAKVFIESCSEAMGNHHA